MKFDLSLIAPPFIHVSTGLRPAGRRELDMLGPRSTFRKRARTLRNLKGVAALILTGLVAILARLAPAYGDVPAACDIAQNGGATFLGTADPCNGLLVVSQSDFTGAGFDGNGSYLVSFDSVNYGPTQWYTGNVTDMSSFFLRSDFNGDIGHWDTSNVTLMDSLFQEASAFNQDIGDWNVEKVTDMQTMFYKASAFNQDIGDWKTSSATNMSSMFRYASSFDQDIGNWDVADVTDMSLMFGDALVFNSDLSGWDTGNVTTMAAMFRYTTAFNQNLGSWDTGNVTKMNDMFLNAQGFNGTIGTWDTRNVTTMRSMFRQAMSFNQDIGDWETQSVTDMQSMFDEATSFNQDIGDWDTRNVAYMTTMFYKATAFSQDISGWDVRLISSEPFFFDQNTDTSYWIDAHKPWWGTPGLDLVSPAQGATDVDMETDLVLTFHEDVQAGSGNISLFTALDDGLVEAFDVAGAAVTFAANTVNVAPSLSLAAGTDYYVLVDANAIEDTTGKPFAGLSDTTDWTFTTQGGTSAPTLQTFSPANAATDVARDTALSLTFDKDVQAGTGHVTLYQAADGSLVEALDVTSGAVNFAGATITLNPAADLAFETGYYVQVDATAITDTAATPNAFAGIADTTTWTFTTLDDTLAPVVGSLVPSNAATGVALDSSLVLTFDEDVQAGTGYVTLHTSSDGSLVEAIDVTSGAVSFAGASVTITPVADLAFETSYYVQVEATAITDTAATPNAFAGIADTTTWTFTTLDDTLVPVVGSLVPSNAATGVALDSSLVLTFDEDVQAGTGQVTLRKSSDGSLVEAIDVTSGTVSFAGTSVTITPTIDWVFETGYYVQIDAGAITDTASTPNAFAGIADTTTWAFTTLDDTLAPVVGSLVPSNAATGVALDTSFTITFDEAVQAGSGNVSLYQAADGGLVEALDVSSGAVSFAGVSVTISPSADLAFESSYYVQIDAGAISDMAASPNAFAGITDTTTWVFTTLDDTLAPVVGSLVPSNAATGVALDASLVLTFDEDVQAGTGQVTLRKSSDGSLVEAIDVTSGAVSFAGTSVTITPSVDLAFETSYYVQIDATAITDAAASPNAFAGIADTTTWAFTTLGDTIAPIVGSLTPSNAATGVALDTSFTITFDEDVQAGTGHVTLYKTSDGSLVEAIDVTSGAVSFAGASVTITPVADLAFETSYYVQIDATTITDTAASPNAFAGIADTTTWAFTTLDDTIAPIVGSLTPSNAATGVALDASLTITFDEAVQAGSGNISLYQAADGGLVEALDVTSGAVSFAGATVTINPTSDLAFETGYYVQIDAGAITDTAASPNAFAGIADTTTWAFTTLDDTLAPVLGSLVPSNAATGVALDASLTITFDEAVQAGSGNVSLYQAADGGLVEALDVTSGAVSFAGATVTINPTSDLAFETSYYVQIDAGTITDMAATPNAFAGIADTTTWAFTTLDDTLAPVLGSLVPSNAATGVALDASFTLTFDEAVQAGLGNVSLYQAADGGLVEALDVTSGAVSFAGATVTINPTSDLAFETGYYVQIDAGAITDTAASPNALAGIADTTTWAFTTLNDTIAPIVGSLTPSNAATGVALDASLTITFDEAVQAGSGNVSLYQAADGALVEALDVTSGAVSFAGATVTINPTSDLAFETGYYVQIDAGTITDMAATPNAFAGIADTTTWAFTTLDDTLAPVLGSLVPSNAAMGVALDASFTLTFDEAVQAGLGNVSLYQAADGSLVEALDVSSDAVSVAGASVTINPAADLAFETSYYVQIDAGAITDTAASPNAFVGITDSTSWVFTTLDDTLAPVLGSLVPGNAATGVALDASLVLTFDEAVQAGTGHVTLRKSSDGSFVEAIDVTSGAVSFAGTSVTITPSVDLAFETSYYVQIDATAITDTAASPNAFAGIADTTTWAFTTLDDTLAPVLGSLVPGNAATGVALDASLVLTFDEVVQAGTGHVTLRKSSDGSLVEAMDVTSSAVSFAGASVTITPTADLAFETSYYVQIDAGTITDTAASPNAFAGIADTTSWAFTTLDDTLAPVVGSLVPSNAATGVALDTSFTITFDEDVQAGTGHVTLRKSSDGSLVEAMDVTSSAVSFAGASVTVTPAADLAFETSYYVQIDATAITDTASTPNAFAGIADTTTWAFTTLDDTVAPVVGSLVPANTATGVALDASLVLTFDTNIQSGTGSIKLFDAAHNSLVEKFDVAGPSVTFAGTTVTVTPTVDLAAETSYYVQIDATAITDTAASPNAFAGIAETNTWTFTTLDDTFAPTLAALSPANAAADVALNTTFTLAFDEDVRAGTGNVTLTKATDNSIVELIDVTSAAVSFAGATVTVQPAADLAFGTSYAVLIDANAITDTAASPNAFAGVADPAIWTFTTLADTGAPNLLSQSPTKGATNVDLQPVLSLSFDEQVQAGTGNITLFGALDGSVVEAIDVTSSAVSFADARVTIRPAMTLDYGSDYYVEVDATAITDTAASPNAFAGILDRAGWTFTTRVFVDSATPELIALQPANGASDLAIDTAISLTFDEEVQAGKGTLTLFDAATNSAVETLDVRSSALAFAGAVVHVTFATDLSYGTQYYIQVTDGAIEDRAANPNAFAGILDATTWAFATRAKSTLGDSESVTSVNSSLAVSNTMAATPLSAANAALNVSAPRAGSSTSAGGSTQVTASGTGASSGSDTGSVETAQTTDGRDIPDYGRLYVLPTQRTSNSIPLFGWLTFGIADASVDAALQGDGTLAYVTFGTEISKSDTQVSGLLYGVETSSWTYEDEPDVDRDGLSVGYYLGQSFEDLTATGSVVFTVSNNAFVDENDATASANSTRLLVTGELRGNQAFDNGASLSPFVNMFVAAEETNDFTYSDGGEVSGATTTVGRVSLGVEYRSQETDTGTYLVRSTMGQTFGTDAVTLSDGSEYSPNTDLTGSLTLGWEPQDQAGSQARVELTLDGIGDQDSETYRLDGYWDRPF